MITSTVKALAVAGVAAASVGTATASAADTGDPVAASIAAYQAAYPSLSDAQARADALGADARRAVYDAAAADASTFGGAWFDPVTGAVNVAATTAAAVERIARYGRRYAVAVKPVRVKHSAAALEEQAAALRAGKGELGKAANGNVGVDVKTNQVVVAVAQDRKAGLASKAAAGNAKLVTAKAAEPEPDAGCTTRSDCDWTIRAGSIMWRGTTTSNTPWCSVGFTARNSSNTRFVLTAGHCTTGLGVNWGIGGQDIGPMGASVDSGVVDTSAIQVTNSGSRVTPAARSTSAARSAAAPRTSRASRRRSATGRGRDGLPVGELHRARHVRQLLRRARHEQRRRRARHGPRRRPRRLRRRQRRRLVLAVLVGQPLRLRHPQPQRQRLPRRRRRHALLVHARRERQGQASFSP